jgi:hypothetical protein
VVEELSGAGFILITREGMNAMPGTIILQGATRE